MIRLLRTNSANPDFIKLVRDLDKYLAVSDGDEHDFYDQFNKLDKINHVILLYENEEAIGCGAIKHYDLNKVEIKRMYVKEENRNNGYAAMILKNLEAWAFELKYHKCILETGTRQTEAIRLYHRNNYKEISKYPPYQNMENSVCFEKILKNQ